MLFQIYVQVYNRDGKEIAEGYSTPSPFSGDYRDADEAIARLRNSLHANQFLTLYHGTTSQIRHESLVPHSILVESMFTLSMKEYSK